jgi:hypothetical protein
MNDFDRLLVALLGLALVAVLVSTAQTTTALTSIGQAITKLVQNVVGAPTGGN